MNWGQLERERKEMVGAVIVFKKGTKPEDAQKLLNELHARGVLDHRSSAMTYDGNYGGPVWYIP